VTDRWPILSKRTNFGIPNEINAIRFLCKTRGSLVAGLSHRVRPEPAIEPAKGRTRYVRELPRLLPPLTFVIVNRLERQRLSASFASMRSQIIAAMSGPPRRLMARMPVGEVTLISVR
jgi:hypothetical protein